ncbi:MAG: hypothetical protein IT160_15280 [Bryobacterales bacterium]|nr:hypothetical protein [Bryobacterales bacterium]
MKALARLVAVSILIAPSMGAAETPFQFSAAGGREDVWGRPRGLVPRVFFGEWLPSLFSRTLLLANGVTDGSKLEWIFTGDEGGFTVTITPGRVKLAQRYYDSFGLSSAKPPTARFPEKTWDETETEYAGAAVSVRVTMDHQMGLLLAVNGKAPVRQRCLLEVRRHQLNWIPPEGEKSGGIRGTMIAPDLQPLTVSVNGSRRHQQIFGFGGILSVPAYHALGDEGKRRWWDLIREYNLLIHREYPNGNRLKPDLSNFDDLRFATPHYYGDNFPNGEISDFEYSRRIQSMGGKVIFEFWELPPWARHPYTAQNGKTYQGAPLMDEYVRAMVGYCRTALSKAGRPPDVVGIQNEVVQAAGLWELMILRLRAGLDAAGFRQVKIHMPDNGTLRGGIENLKAVRQSEPAWRTIDFAASHFYDFQGYYEKPDDYDELISQWRRLAGGKPFLSTELAVNRAPWQSGSFRIAFAQAQLYHKNLAMMDASALMYCWTLIDVEQPVFGATRALAAADRARGNVPRASSYQLRVFGAFSRRLREGMARVDAESPDSGVLVTAWEGKPGRTMVLINCSTVPRQVSVNWPGSAFTTMEVASAYEENAVRKFSGGALRIEPGELLTLTNVPLLTARAQ